MCPFGMIAHLKNFSWQSFIFNDNQHLLHLSLRPTLPGIVIFLINKETEKQRRKVMLEPGSSRSALQLQGHARPFLKGLAGA